MKILKFQDKSTERVKEKCVKNLWLIYSGLFLIIWSIITLPFVLRGNSLIGEADSFNQSFPVFVYIGEYIRQIFQGNLTMFDFRLGLGDDVITALNWHGFGDIFQIISAFVSKEHAEIAYEIVMTLKYYFCGISFMVYCRSYVKNPFYQLSGALLYSFSIFSLFWGLNCWMFLNPMITLPLILHGIDQLLERRKELSLFMIIALFIQALNGFYYLYMEIIIAAIYVLIILAVCLGQCKITFKYAVSRIMVIAGEGLLGVSLGAILFVPSIIGFLTSSRTDDVLLERSVINAFVFEDYGYYLRSLAHLLIPNVYVSVITSSSIVLLGLVVFLLNSKSTMKIKILTVFWSVAFWIPIVGNLMNGFSYWTDRWYFVVLMFLVLGTMIAIDEGKMVGKREVIIFEVIAATSILTHIWFSEKTMGLVIQVVVFVLEIIIVPFLWNRNDGKVFVLLIVTLLVINGALTFGPKALGGCGYSAGFKGKGDSYREISESVRNIAGTDGQFERWDIYESSLGSSLVKDYYGTAEYFSMLNSYTSEFYRELYISPGVRSVTWVLKGLDGRIEIESLLSTAWYMDFETDAGGQANAFIQKTEEILPLGFMYDQYMLREEFNKLNAIERSSVMLECIILDELSKNSGGGMKELTAADILKYDGDEEINIKLRETGLEYAGNQFTTCNQARIRVYLQNMNQAQHNDEYYVKLSDFCLLDEGTQDIFVGNKNIQLRNREDDYYIGPDEFWVNVTELKEDEEGTYFDIIFNENKSYTLGNIQVYQHSVNREAIEDRKCNTLQNVVFEPNRITGNIVVDSEAPQALFLSVPYSKGWKAYIDGIETEINKANIAFMSVYLEPGEHEVVFSYRTPGLREGCLISIIALIVLVIVVYKLYRKKMVV